MPLPIEPVIPELRRALASTRAVVLAAPPGAGKTTVVPLTLLAEPWLDGQKIVMLEPRRLAARSAATWMARTLDEAAGVTVGYRTRLDTRVGPRTRIEVVTEGILTRMLQHDLALDGVGLVIFDEFHERSIAADLGLAMTLATQESLREDLRVLVMSATIDDTRVAALLGGAPVIRSEGRSWPVETRYAPLRPEQAASGYQSRSHLEDHVARVVRDVFGSEPGSLLVFLPGAGEIRRVEENLRSQLPRDASVHALHGSLPFEQQEAAIVPAAAGRRKVVLATSIAETSLTIEGIRVVIDSGLMRVPRFSARTGMTYLDTVRVSRASADQRRGRAGRLEPGVCVRCWSAGEDAGLVPYTRPEIVDADLAALVLDLAAAGFTDPGELKWLDPPPRAAILQARELLQLLGAVDERGRVTTHGKAMAELGTHPRLSHMLLRAASAGSASVRTATVLVSLLEERDMLRGANGPPPADVRLRLDAVDRDVDDVQLAGATVDRNLAARIRDGAREWERRVRRVDGGSPDRSREVLDAGLLLALAYPDRVAMRRDAPGRFVLRNGRGAMLPPTDPLAHAGWIVAALIDDSGRDARILLAAPIDIDELVVQAAEQVTVRDEIAWRRESSSVTARRRTMLGALILRDVAIPEPDAEAIARELLVGVRDEGIGAVPWPASANSLRQRVEFIRYHDPSWPAMDDAALTERLETWLLPHIEGVRRVASLAEVDLLAALRSLLSWQQQRDLDTFAPVSIEVPSGSRITIDYSDPATPVLAVRLQEVFGMTETPRLLAGRVPVTMQLLSPARRPVQLTRDLESFWKSGYFDVRKDLRGRYPKHFWPENPLQAEPVRGARKKGEGKTEKGEGREKG